MLPGPCYGRRSSGQRDRVRLILDKEHSPDNRWHGKTGIIERIYVDAAGKIPGVDVEDSLLFEIDIDGVDEAEQPDIHFRWSDIRPFSEEMGDEVEEDPRSSDEI